MNNYRPQGFSFLPVVIKNLIIINGLFFLATISFQKVFQMDLINLLGLHYPSAQQFAPYQFITYLFLHGGYGHIFFNMFTLWMFGNVLENIWGSKRFLIYYLATGIGAGLTHYGIFYYEIAPVLSQVNLFLSDPSLEAFVEFNQSEYFTISTYEMQRHYNIFADEYNRIVAFNQDGALNKAIEYMYIFREDLLNAPVVVGASGAVFGILLAFGIMFPNDTIYLYLAIPIKVKYFVITLGIFELIRGIMNDPRDSVAHFAHLGGMIFGYILLHYWAGEKAKK